uniref:7-hydroxymethyl chlorophyll a reductase n=1 Tax=Tetraselmis sp. GSL018 TaxID=582737 RepID=A0A061SGL6_9CHLO
MQDYRVHIKHLDGSFEYKPYFCLPANELSDVIATSCYSCFDYPNALADLVIGYMGVPYQNVNMTSHPQYITVRNERGREMLDVVRSRLEVIPTMESGGRRPFVMQTVIADDDAKLGLGPESPAPLLVGNVIAAILEKIGPRGLEFARYSLDYHYIRNHIFVQRHMGRERAERHTPEFAKRLVQMYNRDGQVDARLRLSPDGRPPAQSAESEESRLAPALLAAGTAAALGALWLSLPQ